MRTETLRASPYGEPSRDDQCPIHGDKARRMRRLALDVRAAERRIKESYANIQAVRDELGLLPGDSLLDALAEWDDRQP